LTDNEPEFASLRPTERPTPRGASRRARRDQQARIRRWIGIGAGVLAVLLVALVATDTLRLPGGSRPKFAGASGDAPTGSGEERRGPVRTLTATTPMRLWVAGDSLAYALGQSLGKQTAATGVVKPVYDARVSSGLNSPTFFDWPAHAKKEIGRLDPESIVYIIGANDLGVVGGNDWKTAYGAKIDAMMTELTGNPSTRHVYWIGPPTFRDKTRHEAAKQLGELMRAKASEHRNVIYIDGFEIFADNKGKYQDKLPNEAGTTELVRSNDGVHFTAAGGNRLADAVFAVLNRDWDIKSQTVPGALQTVEQTDGCCKTPSGSGNTQWLTGPPATNAPTNKSGTATTTTAKKSATPSSTSAPAASTTAAPATTTTTTAASTTTTT